MDDGELRFITDVRPAGDLQTYWETVFGLAQDGKVNANGLPNLLQLAVVAPLADGYDSRVPASPIPWPSWSAPWLCSPWPWDTSSWWPHPGGHQLTLYPEHTMHLTLWLSHPFSSRLALLLAAVSAAESLESRLAVPSVLFFFLPFLFLILVPLLLPILELL